MQQELSSSFIFVIFYQFLLIVVGVVCLVYSVSNIFFKGRRIFAGFKVLPWQISFFEFLFLTGLICWGIMGAGSASLFLYKFFTKSEEVSDIHRTLVSSLSMQLTVLGILAGYWYFFRKPTINTRVLSWRKALSKAGYAFFTAIPLLLITEVILLRALQYFEIELPKQAIIELASQTHSRLEFTLLVVIVVCLAPVVEELIFRGMIYRFLKGKMLPLYALCLNAFLFALVHMNLFSFLPLFLLSLLLAYSYEKTGNIKVPILFHALFNLNSLFLLSITV
jgi:membrane protease YdiL (CAAX protease family)